MQFKKKLFSVALVTMTIVRYGAAANAATLEEGWALYDNANFAKSAEVFRALKPIPTIALGALCRMAVNNSAISDPATDLGYCTQGVDANDPESLRQMGYARFAGNARMGVVQDQTLSFGYFSKAVIAGYAPASDTLCEIFYDNKAFARAAPFCKVAAAANMSHALYYLALMSVSGQGMIQDLETGRKFALLSASKNNFDSYILLSEMAKKGGIGKPKDNVAAYSWALLAGAANPEADLSGDRNALGLDASHMEAAQKMATSWKKMDVARWRDLYPAPPK